MKQRAIRWVWVSLAGAVFCASTAHARDPQAELPGRGHVVASSTRLDNEPHRRHQPLSPAERGRRRLAVSRIRARLGNDFVARDDVKAEFNIHAWRIARLRRTVIVAGEQKNETLRSKAVALISKETARHERRLSELRAARPSADAGALAVSPPNPIQSNAAPGKAKGQP